MCFSAEASFTAAAVLGIAGCINVKIINDKRYLLLAVIPFIFAFQQLLEGFLWSTTHNVVFDHTVQFDRFSPLEVRMFLFVALLVWPIWIPLSLLVAETVSWRRKILSLLLALGLFYVFMSLLGLYEIADRHGITVQIVNKSIQYVLPVQHNNAYVLLYCLATILPAFISSVNKLWWFGVLSLIGFVIAQIYYYETFISVWCFFAAWVSLGLIYVLYYNRVAEKEAARKTESNRN